MSIYESHVLSLVSANKNKCPAWITQRVKFTQDLAAPDKCGLRVTISKFTFPSTLKSISLSLLSTYRTDVTARSGMQRGGRTKVMYTVDMTNMLSLS